jgi:hypothetical protein
LLLYSLHLPLGVPNGLVINHASSKLFSGAVAGEKVEDFCEGSFSQAHPLLCLLFCFALLYLFLPASFYQKPKKFRILGSYYFFTLVYYV